MRLSKFELRITSADLSIHLCTIANVQQVILHVSHRAYLTFIIKVYKGTMLSVCLEFNCQP